MLQSYDILGCGRQLGLRNLVRDIVGRISLELCSSGGLIYDVASLGDGANQPGIVGITF